MRPASHMPDAEMITLGVGVGIDGHGVLLGLADAQTREGQRVLPGADQGQGVLVIAFAVIFPEDGGGAVGQRAVHIDGKIPVALYSSLRLDLTDEVEQFLGAAHRKAGDDHIAAPVQRSLQNVGELGQIVGAGRMVPVPVGGFHHHKVRRSQQGGVPQNGLVFVADVPGKHDGLGGAALGDAQRDAGAAQKMPHVREGGLHPVKDAHGFAVGLGLEQVHGLLGIPGGVLRLHHRPPAALGLAVFPLGILLLDVGGILQHDLAQVGGGIGGVDRPPEAVFVHIGDAPRVVDVGVGEQNGLDLRRGTGQRGVLVGIPPLLHAAVHQKAMARRLHHGAAAGYLPGCAQKLQFHARTSFVNRTGLPPPDVCTVSFPYIPLKPALPPHPVGCAGVFMSDCGLPRPWLRRRLSPSRRRGPRRSGAHRAGQSSG